MLKPSTSEALTVEVKAHEIEVEDTPGAGDGNGGDNGGNQNQGGSVGSDMGSAEDSILRKLLIAMGAIGVISAVIAAVMNVLHQR